MKIEEIPSCDRPREKLIKKGPTSLKDTELLALIIRYGSRGSDALETAVNLLHQSPVATLPQLSYKELQAIPGIDVAKSCSILAAIELGTRVHQSKSERHPVIATVEQALMVIRDITNSKKEHFIVLYLNARNHLIDREVISIGTVNASLVHPREVFEPAIRNVATQLILAHNHPSGDPEPSDADITLTKRLQQVGIIMGIEVTDHIIVAGPRYISFREKRIIS